MMYTLSIAGLAYLAGFATPHVWVWFDWWRSRTRRSWSE